MKVAANFELHFIQPEDKALRRLADAITNNYLQSMPVFKNTLLRDGTLLSDNYHRSWWYVLHTPKQGSTRSDKRK